jgi:hypothetical protein
MKLAVIGSRGFINMDLLSITLMKYYPDITQIISGGARGADKLAKHYAREKI